MCVCVQIEVIPAGPAVCVCVCVCVCGHAAAPQQTPSAASGTPQPQRTRAKQKEALFKGRGIPLFHPPPAVCVPCWPRLQAYGVPSHMVAIKQHGPCPIHRRSFEPVKSMTGWVRPKARKGGKQAGNA